MATIQQVGEYIYGCSLFNGESPLLPTNEEIYLRNNLRKVVMKCVKHAADHPRTPYDVFLEIMNRDWKEPRWGDKTRVAAVTQMAIRALVNLHSATADMRCMATDVSFTSHGIDAQVDYLARKDNDPYLILFDYRDRVPSKNEALKMSYELQAAARAHNLESDEDIEFLCYLCLLNGTVIYSTYDPDNKVEVVAQAINAGAKVKRHCELCPECTNNMKCAVTIQ